MNDLRNIDYILNGALIPFRTFEVSDPKYIIDSAVGNACYLELEDDHYTVEHHLSSGGRVIVSVKYEPDWKDEDDTE